MTMEELEAGLSGMGCPIAYHYFQMEQDVPYIIIFEKQASIRGADFKNFIKAQDVIVELYTETKTRDLEERLERVLMGEAFEKYSGYLPEERMYMVSYHLKLCNKIREV